MRPMMLYAGTGLICLLASGALAQTNATSSPAERRDQIAKVQEMLADPDPLMRLANMEAIVNSGDPLKLEVALRTALSSDDVELRGLAMRAYLATRKEITFDIVLPPPIEKQVDAARFDSTALRNLGGKYDFLGHVLSVSSKFHLVFKEYAFAQDRGTVEAQNDAPFTITGDKFSSLVALPGLGNCYVDFRPTPQRAFEGSMACGNWPPLTISAPVF